LQLELLASVYNSPADRFYFTTATFEFAGDVSLSWYLTAREQRLLRAEADRQGSYESQPMRDLLAWWKGRS
jgi:hypothetical protein